MTVFSIFITAFFVILGLVKKQSKFVIIGLMACLYILFAFENADMDYNEYVEMYRQIGSGYGRALEYEYLYVWISKLGNTIGLTFDGLRYIVCLFEVLFLYNAIKKYTDNAAMVLALFFVYPATLNAELFRWLLGMCVIIFGMGFLLKAKSTKDYIIYFASVIVASLIHTSCWVFLIYFLLVFKDRKKIYKIVSNGYPFDGTIKNHLAN